MNNFIRNNNTCIPVLPTNFASKKKLLITSMEDDDDDVELSLARASFSVEQIQRRYICIRVYTPLVIMSVFVYMHPKVSGILPLTEH